MSETIDKNFTDEVRAAGRKNDDTYFKDAKSEIGDKKLFPRTPGWLLREQNTEKPD